MNIKEVDYDYDNFPRLSGTYHQRSLIGFRYLIFCDGRTDGGAGIVYSISFQIPIPYTYSTTDRGPRCYIYGLLCIWGIVEGIAHHKIMIHPLANFADFEHRKLCLQI